MWWLGLGAGQAELDHDTHEYAQEPNGVCDKLDYACSTSCQQMLKHVEMDLVRVIGGCPNSAVILVCVKTRPLTGWPGLGCSIHQYA